MDLMHFDISKHAISQRTGRSKEDGQQMIFFGSSASIDKIRAEYNELAVESQKPFILDYGNLKPSELRDIHNLADILVGESHSLPVLLCNSSHESVCLSAFFRQHHAVGIVDKSLDKYVDYDGLNLEHTKLIGAQQHAISLKPKVHAKENQIRLSDVRFNIQRAEVALRSIDIAVIHLDAIRFGDNIGNHGSNTCGLTIEEACHLAKYAGASINLKAVIITGFDENRDVLHMMAKNMALLIYYLAQGFKIRCVEKDNIKNAATYTVIPDELDTELTFLEIIQSGRWWLQVKDERGNPALIPCTKKDYEDACQNVISERIMKVFAKV